MTYYYIEAIKKYIETHFEESMTLDEIAGEFGYSKYHLNRRFQEGTGKSLHSYIRERRLWEAAKLLLETERTIVEIALSVGYSSQQAFTFAFKQEFDCTPQVYRKETLLFEELPLKEIKAGMKLENPVLPIRRIGGAVA